MTEFEIDTWNEYGDEITSVQGVIDDENGLGYELSPIVARVEFKWLSSDCVSDPDSPAITVLLRDGRVIKCAAEPWGYDWWRDAEPYVWEEEIMGAVDKVVLGEYDVEYHAGCLMGEFMTTESRSMATSYGSLREALSWVEARERQTGRIDFRVVVPDGPGALDGPFFIELRRKPGDLSADVTYVVTR